MTVLLSDLPFNQDKNKENRQLISSELQTSKQSQDLDSEN